MVMEAMRLSLLEHEEQQRKQAEEDKKKKAAAATPTASTSQEAPAVSGAAAASGSSRVSAPSEQPSGSNAAMRSPPPAAQSVLDETEARSPTGGAPLSPPRPPAHLVDPASLGLSQTTMDELRELIDGGPSPPASSASTSSPNGTSSLTPTELIGSARPQRSVPAPAPVPVPQPVAGLGSVLAEQHDPSISSRHGYPSPPPEADAGGTKHAATYSTTTASFDATSSAATSPNSSGFAVPRSRVINPNNPFRRSLGEHH